MSKREMWARTGMGALAIMGVVTLVKGSTWRQNSQRANCQSNLKQIGLAVSQYTRDYDEMMPLGNAWTQELWPYSKSTEVFECPRRGAFPQGYALHRAAAGMNTGVFDEADKVALTFDADGPTPDTLDDGSLLPRPPRHFEGANVAYVDGHVKWRVNPQAHLGYDARILKMRALYFRNRETYYRELKNFEPGADPKWLRELKREDKATVVKASASRKK